MFVSPKPMLGVAAVPVIKTICPVAVSPLLSSRLLAEVRAAFPLASAVEPTLKAALPEANAVRASV